MDPGNWLIFLMLRGHGIAFPHDVAERVTALKCSR
jgi:hypothetical protein